jgi:hypothetical protein
VESLSNLSVPLKYSPLKPKSADTLSSLGSWCAFVCL